MKTQVRVGSSGEGDKALVTRRRRLNACDGMKRRVGSLARCVTESPSIWLVGGKEEKKSVFLKSAP